MQSVDGRLIQSTVGFSIKLHNKCWQSESEKENGANRKSDRRYHFTFRRWIK